MNQKEMKDAILSRVFIKLLIKKLKKKVLII